MRSLLLGILFIIIIGFGGLVYRNAVEHPSQPIVCPLDALKCPDGTSVSRTGNSCTFPACPPPNVSLSDINISFALPTGFAVAELPDAAAVAAYEMPVTASSSLSAASILVRRYAIQASSTALATIQQTAVSGTSGLPIGVTSFSSTVLGNTLNSHRFTVVLIERFEGVIDTAYYLARSTDVLRFDAIDRNVNNWTNPTLDTSTLPAHTALKNLLTTLQGQ
jgi:hypothetical protein